LSGCEPYNLSQQLEKLFDSELTSTKTSYEYSFF